MTPNILAGIRTQYFLSQELQSKYHGGKLDSIKVSSRAPAADQGCQMIYFYAQTSQFMYF
jgi:hypothetical protein